jgi:hypothetical protein
MNWKNVLSLMQVDRKSGRLIRGRKLTRYRENRFLAYWPYWTALGVGLAVGLLVGVAYNMVVASDVSGAGNFKDGALSLFLSLPTLVLIISLVFTLFQQIQRSGVRASAQVPYWLPVTWQEHTLASILASLFGFPLASVLFIATAIIAFSPFSGLIAPALATSLAVFAAAFMASATTEVFRVLQVRFIGAVYKSTGRAAVWVRFAGSLAFFIVFYFLYFYVIYGAGIITFIQNVASVQTAAWFVPFVWPGLTLFYSFMSGELLIGLAFMVVSILFIAGLFFLATSLNRRFGLYEPPAITVSRGIYAPKTGALGRLGFSSLEAALIRKDLKAFTRRRELMAVFIFPIIMIIIPLFQTFGSTGAPPGFQVSTYLAAYSFLFPAAIMAMSLGNFMVGEEGQAVWRIFVFAHRIGYHGHCWVYNLSSDISSHHNSVNRRGLPHFCFGCTFAVKWNTRRRLHRDPSTQNDSTRNSHSQLNYLLCGGCRHTVAIYPLYDSVHAFSLHTKLQHFSFSGSVHSNSC